MSESSFWPEMKMEKIRSPFSILKEQGSYVSVVSGGLVEGMVSRITDGDGDVVVSLEFVAPALGMYRYEVLTFWYNPLSLYPVHPTAEEAKIETEAELLDYLKTKFNSPEVKTALQSLISQSLEGEEIKK